ncbi:MAG TPA: hypothetical protein VJZ32_03565 [Candidatus Bathyarchaeia archaeon]|nr:hypothetical protein [Candidatus Bathyarchaeia archaeon]
MDYLVILLVIGAAIFAALLFRFLRARKTSRQGEPIIELEKLVNCTSCGSLVPEGVNKCAFCGAVQKKSS